MEGVKSFQRRRHRSKNRICVFHLNGIESKNNGSGVARREAGNLGEGALTGRKDDERIIPSPRGAHWPPAGPKRIPCVPHPALQLLCDMSLLLWGPFIDEGWREHLFFPERKSQIGKEGPACCAQLTRPPAAWPRRGWRGAPAEVHGNAPSSLPPRLWNVPSGGGGRPGGAVLQAHADHSSSEKTWVVACRSHEAAPGPRVALSFRGNQMPRGKRRAGLTWRAESVGD
uniref:Uncharacterized protein n=1 Tax=Myotis myotis TaxID=51298 RepID=A0A7J7U5A4_MYOMY|nr:hypothetical protein mMyoMyo1_008895 [Myotis myotis]